MKRQEKQHMQTPTNYDQKESACDARDSQGKVAMAAQVLNANADLHFSLDQELEALYALAAENICLYDREGYLLQMSEAVRAFLHFDPPPDYASLSLKQRAAQFIVRASDGTPLVEEEWPLRRILNGEMLKHTHASDVLVRRNDGQDILVNVCGAPLRDRDGAICGALTICSDVTELRRSQQRTQQALDALLTLVEVLVQETFEQSGEEGEDQGYEPALKRLLQQLAQLFACERVGIVLLDPETEVLHPMVVLGISPEHERYWRKNLEGARLSNFFEDSLLTLRLRSGEVLSLDISLPALRDQPSYRLIVPILKGYQLSGMLMLGYGTTRPHPEANELAIMKTIARFAAVVIERSRAQDERDQALAALQSANEELEHMNRLKNDLITAISHEFRTSLTSIQGFSEMIRDGNYKIVEMKEFATDIYSDAKRLTRKINELVDLDLNESRRSQLHLTWVDLNEIILDIIVQARRRAPEHTFRTHLSHVMPMLMGDREKLTRVTLSFLNNAIWYSPEGGEIIVTSAVEGNLVHVYVRDFGVGLQQEELELIFERYAQIERPVIEHGLDEEEIDLPLARDFVEMHGGHVWAESIPGKGSVFHFTIQFVSLSAATKGE